jgi:heat shock protein HtpX
LCIVPRVDSDATGPSRNSALMALSTGLLQNMNRDKVEAVLAHEVSHIANADMVTLTLLQGVVNTLVIALARIVGYAVDRLLSSDSDEQEASSPGVAYWGWPVVRPR